MFMYPLQGALAGRKLGEEGGWEEGSVVETAVRGGRVEGEGLQMQDPMVGGGGWGEEGGVRRGGRGRRERREREEESETEERRMERRGEERRGEERMRGVRGGCEESCRD